jgi:diguanylate cyclase (GGDEF)-like protein
MMGSLSQRIYLFTLSGSLLIAILLGSIIWSSQTLELAFSRDDYAQRLDNQTNILKQLVISDNIYASQYNTSNWQSQQQKLTVLFKSAPQLTPHLQAIQNSIHSQNENLKRLFTQITKNKLKNASAAIKVHLKGRLMMQLESIRSDSLELSAIANTDIHNTIKHEAIFIISVIAVTLFVLLFSSFTLMYIVRISLDEVKSAFKKNHSGHFQKIQLSHRSEEFDSIVKAFNAMNEKLSDTTVSLAVMKKVVEDRTHVLEQLSNTDPLTKVANRRALFERATMEFSRAKRGKNKLSLLLLDCDLFKGINDDFGHLIGDEFLIHICDVCRQEVRDIDFLARYGGEEFIIVLPNCDLNGGIETASRIQSTLAQSGVSVEGKQVFVTLSIGVSMLSERHKNLEQFINEADKAMYQAKKNGRNRIESLTPNNLH